MGLEQNVETGLRDAFNSAFTTAGLTLPTYRRFWSDDEAGADDEKHVMPFVGIVAHPGIPTGVQSIFRGVPVDVLFATQVSDDPKRDILRAIYEAARDTLDEGAITLSGASVTGIEIEDGECGIEGNMQTVSLRLTVNVCGAE